MFGFVVMFMSIWLGCVCGIWVVGDFNGYDIVMFWFVGVDCIGSWFDGWCWYFFIVVECCVQCWFGCCVDWLGVEWCWYVDVGFCVLGFG